MKNRSLIRRIHPFIVILSFLLINSASAQTFRILTEEFPPYNFTQDGKIAGISTEIVRELLKRTGLQDKMEVLPWNETEADLLLNAAPMHDIGKIGIPGSILLKPAKLNDEEWKKMRLHPAFGAEIIGEHDSELLQEARIVALTHHEKWNGKGYPSGTKGASIPLSGRIVAMADVFDALTSERPYKKAWPVEKALDLLKEESGQHFDPQLVPAFLEALPEVLKIKDQYAEKQ